MNLHEYQAKNILASYGVAVPRGLMAASADEAEAAARGIGGSVWVVKAQVHAGGRGKAGGVKLADGPADARAKAEQILGLDIKGHVVRRLMLAQTAEIETEYYVSFLLD
ncbi:MAG TPA: ATP-grasp domain-containing protein, partial [Steroidobacteraceae bacterium]